MGDMGKTRGLQFVLATIVLVASIVRFNLMAQAFPISVLHRVELCIFKTFAAA